MGAGRHALTVYMQRPPRAVCGPSGSDGTAEVGREPDVPIWRIRVKVCVCVPIAVDVSFYAQGQAKLKIAHGVQIGSSNHGAAARMPPTPQTVHRAGDLQTGGR